jgi:hypothetical protein
VDPAQDAVPELMCWNLAGQAMAACWKADRPHRELLEWHLSAVFSAS